MIAWNTLACTHPQTISIHLSAAWSLNRKAEKKLSDRGTMAVKNRAVMILQLFVLGKENFELLLMGVFGC